MNWGWIRCHDLFSQIRSWRWYCNSVAVSCFLTFTVQPLLSLSRASFFFWTHTHTKNKNKRCCVCRNEGQNVCFEVFMNERADVEMLLFYFICKMRWLTSIGLRHKLDRFHANVRWSYHRGWCFIGGQTGLLFDLMPPRVCWLEVSTRRCSVMLWNSRHHLSSPSSSEFQKHRAARKKGHCDPPGVFLLIGLMKTSDVDTSHVKHLFDEGRFVDCLGRSLVLKCDIQHLDEDGFLQILPLLPQSFCLFDKISKVLLMLTVERIWHSSSRDSVIKRFWVPSECEKPPKGFSSTGGVR